MRGSRQVSAKKTNCNQSKEAEPQAEKQKTKATNKPKREKIQDQKSKKNKRKIIKDEQKFQETK